MGQQEFLLTAMVVLLILAAAIGFATYLNRR